MLACCLLCGSGEWRQAYPIDVNAHRGRIAADGTSDMVVKRRLRNAPAWNVEPERLRVFRTEMHRICHRKIHATFSEKELAREFHTWQALREHPVIADFV